MRTGVAARGVERRNDAEEQAGEQGCAKGIRDHLPVDGNVREPREARRRQGLQEIRAPRRDQQAGGAADQAEQQAFGQHLAQQSAPPGAERRPNRQLALPRGRAGEQQVRDVGAGDQQDEAHRTEQDDQRPLDVTHDLLVHRHEADTDPGVHWILFLQPRGDGVHL